MFEILQIYFLSLINGHFLQNYFLALQYDIRSKLFLQIETNGKSRSRHKSMTFYTSHRKMSAPMSMLRTSRKLSKFGNILQNFKEIKVG